MRKLFSLSFLLCAFLTGFSQNFTISGSIRDAENGEGLIGATVYDKSTLSGVSANLYGFYSLTLPEGTYDLVYSFVGYTPVVKTIELNQNIQLDVELGAKSEQLKEVIITGEASNKNVEAVEMSVVSVKMETIKKIPSLLGEVDVLRAIQLLPGVQNGGEGSTGFFVRGGASDQNLILLDEAFVYNASHLLGFFSVFNQDAIKDAQLYKGGIPAEYGGRLSSVLDVRMKDGNSKKFSGAGGIGLISSRLTLEGPIAKDKASFILSGRRSYADLFLALSNNEGLRESTLYFYDLNGKVNWKINDKNRVYLSAYTGRDILGVSTLFRLGWGNQTITGRWNHIFGDKLFSNLTGIYSTFDYLLGIPEGPTAFDWTSRIQNVSLKNDYTYYANAKNTVKFGFQSTFHTFSPATFTPSEDNESFNEFKLFDRFAWENGVYVSNEQKFGGRWSVKYGLRFSSFSNVGTDTLYNFDQNYDTIPGNSFTAYPSGEIYNTYMGLEPRLGIKFTLDDRSSLKASYNRMNQYLHLASNSTAAAPIDVWMPSSPNIKPQRADQVALGYFRNFRQNTFETSVEVYYKYVQNQIDFKDFAQLIFNPLLDGEVRPGSATSYGAEFFIRKQTGAMTGWISYTLSRAIREVPEINNENLYPANYDRPHNLSIVYSWDIMDRLNASATFVYNSGAPVTVPTGRFEYQGLTVPVYSDRNGARMPAYHRADFSLTYDLKKKRENQRFTHSWNLSIFNIYSRKNPYAINFVEANKVYNFNEDWVQLIRDSHPIFDRVIEAYDNPNRTEAQMTYLFPIIPSITYNFKF
jgi:hypothetical protein